MSGKNEHRDQKRRAKQAKKMKEAKSSKRGRTSVATPYEGRKYQAESWVPHVFETELAIYETIKLSGERLTNDQVHEALVELIGLLRHGISPVLTEDDAEVPFEQGREVDYLIWNIRRHWGILFERHGSTARSDLVGILRTLLYSLKAHAWNTGASRGYVAFLLTFLEGRDDPYSGGKVGGLARLFEGL